MPAAGDQRQEGEREDDTAEGGREAAAQKAAGQLLGPAALRRKDIAAEGQVEHMTQFDCTCECS